MKFFLKTIPLLIALMGLFSQSVLAQCNAELTTEIQTSGFVGYFNNNEEVPVQIESSGTIYNSGASITIEFTMYNAAGVSTGYVYTTPQINLVEEAFPGSGVYQGLGNITTAFVTPDDPSIPDGFYYLNAKVYYSVAWNTINKFTTVWQGQSPISTCGSVGLNFDHCFNQAFWINYQYCLGATIQTRVDKFGVARARVTPSGGSGNYSYSWNTGSNHHTIVVPCGCVDAEVTVTDNLNNCSYTTSAVVCSPVACTVDDGVKRMAGKVNKTPSVSIFPNPADDFVVIEVPASAERGTVKLIDPTGKQLLEQAFEQTSTTRLDVSSIKQGFYILKLESDGQLVGQQKLMVK
jgi:hypothetical protein